MLMGSSFSQGVLIASYTAELFECVWSFCEVGAKYKLKTHEMHAMCF